MIINKNYLSGKFAVLFSAFLMLIAISCSKNNSYSTSPTSPNPSSNPNAVSMQNEAFNPKDTTVPMGTTVTWTNNDNITHTVVSGVPGSPDGLFNSGNMSKNQTFSYTFNTKGTFKYYCSVHPAIMTGTVTVQ